MPNFKFSRLRVLLAFVCLVVIFPVYQKVWAEVPGHNPDLDSRCEEGFKWSRKTVACEQTNCPPGAGRTYDLNCNCGEAWDLPFRTCIGDVIGLVTHCVPKGTECESVTPAFDIYTGDCKTDEGYQWNADKSDCIKVFPDEITCQVVDLDGNPVSGVDLRLGEYNENNKVLNSDKIKTNSQGNVTFSIKNNTAARVKFIFANQQGYYQSAVEFKSDDDTVNCEIKVYNQEQIGNHLRTEMENFYTSACIDSDTMEKIRTVKFDFDSDVSTSQYDAESGTLKISSGELNSGYEDLMRTLVHEFGHAISDRIIDPSGLYLKGYPLYGKYVGGKHDNWTPTKSVGTYPFDVDGAELAFEEGMADFLALLYFQSKGKVYQANLTSDRKALQTLAGLKNKQDIKRTEGAVSSFLWELYKNQAQSGEKGAGRAAGNFMRAVRYDKRHSWVIGFPARDINEFIAAKIKSDNNDKADSCSPNGGQQPDINTLAKKYGFIGDNKVRLRVVPLDQNDLSEISKQFDQQGLTKVRSLNSFSLPSNTEFNLPANLGNLVIDRTPPGSAQTGKVEKLTFTANKDAKVKISANGTVTILSGQAEIEHAFVKTDQLAINHQKTRYFVDVQPGENGEVRIQVMEGAVSMAAVSDPADVYALNQEEAVIYSEAGGYQVAEFNLEPPQIESTDNDAEISDVLELDWEPDFGSFGLGLFQIIICCIFCVVLVVVLILVVIYLKSKRKNSIESN